MTCYTGVLLIMVMSFTTVGPVGMKLSFHSDLLALLSLYRMCFFFYCKSFLTRINCLHTDSLDQYLVIIYNFSVFDSGNTEAVYSKWFLMLILLPFEINFKGKFWLKFPTFVCVWQNFTVYAVCRHCCFLSFFFLCFYFTMH